MKLVSSGLKMDHYGHKEVSLFEVELKDLFEIDSKLRGVNSLNGQIDSLDRVLTLDSPDNQRFTREVSSALRKGYFIGSTILYGGKRGVNREWVFAIDESRFRTQLGRVVHYDPDLEDHFLLTHCSGEIGENVRISNNREIRALRTSSFKAGDCNIGDLHSISDHLTFMTGDPQAPDKVRSIMRKEELQTIYLSMPREGHVTSPIIYRDGKSLYLRPLNKNLPLGQGHVLISE